MSRQIAQPSLAAIILNVLLLHHLQGCSVLETPYSYNVNHIPLPLRRCTKLDIPLYVRCISSPSCRCVTTWLTLGYVDKFSPNHCGYHSIATYLEIPKVTVVELRPYVLYGHLHHCSYHPPDLGDRFNSLYLNKVHILFPENEKQPSKHFIAVKLYQTRTFLSKSQGYREMRYTYSPDLKQGYCVSPYPSNHPQKPY